MKLSEVLKETDIEQLAVAYSGLATAKTADFEAIRRIAEIVAVTTANRLGINLEIDEWK